MLTSSELISLGIKQGELFGKILKTVKSCTIKEEAENIAREMWSQFLTNKQQEQGSHKSIKMIPGSVWDWLCHNPVFIGMCSIETGNNTASNSEKRRWLENGSVLINGLRPEPDWMKEPLFDFVFELVFFSGSKKQITMV